MRPLLVAGCGYVGGIVAARLVASGREVWGLKRSPPVPDGVRPILADLVAGGLGDSDLGTREVDLCFLLSPDAHDEGAYRRAYLEGLRAFERRGHIHRIVFASSTAVYGEVEGWVDEETPCVPRSSSGQILLEAEELVRTIASEAVVLRLGGIYGPGRDQTIRRIREGLAIAPAEGPRFGNRIHRDDAAAAFVHALSAAPGCYTVVDDDPADLREVQRWLCERLEIDVSSLTPASPSQRGGPKRVRNRRLRESGLELGYPTFREGYAELLSSLR